MSNRTVRSRGTPHLPPVQRIELGGTPSKWRIAAVILLLVVGSAALAQGFQLLLTGDAGWQEIQAGSGQGITCAQDFTFFYNVSSGAEKRTVTNAYTQAAARAWQLFTADTEVEGVNNVKALNSHPNEVLTVDPLLYQAFEQLQRHGERSVYLAPMLCVYDDIFTCTDDTAAAYYDPARSPEMAAWYAEVAAFAADPAAVNVELLGDNRLRLNVSPAYAAYAAANEIDRYVDLGWLKNAFIIDSLADAVLATGCTRGTISSRDGFVRCLDGGAGDSPEQTGSYSLNLFDRKGSSVLPLAVMDYTGALSAASLYNYPLTSQDTRRCYTFADGSVCTLYLDPADGRCRTALPQLVAYAKDGTVIGCAELALTLAPLYVADTLPSQALESAAGRGIESIRVEGQTIHATDPALTLRNVAEGYTVQK